MNTFSLFSDFKSLKTVSLFLEVFSHLKAYILLINSWLYVEFEVDRINYLTEKETNWFLPAARAYSFPPKIENKFGDRMIKQLLNSVIAKYRDLSVSRRSIICLGLRLLKIIDKTKEQCINQSTNKTVHGLESSHLILELSLWLVLFSRS